jgi:hypothetical protein
VLLPCFREFFLCAENWQLLSELNKSVGTGQTSRAVSNEIYGALILEPTIPSTVPVCEKYEDLDDFWLDLAKGQTLKQTNFHQSVGPSVSLQQKHAPTDLFSY